MLQCWFRSGLRFQSIVLLNVSSGIILFLADWLSGRKWGRLCCRQGIVGSFSGSRFWVRSSISLCFRNFRLRWDRKPGGLLLTLCSRLWWWIQKLPVRQCPRPALWFSCSWHWRSWTRTRLQGSAHAGCWTFLRPCAWACSFCRHWSHRSWWTWRACCNLTFWFLG